MIEPNIARLWERALSSKSPFDAANARGELRQLGVNPYAPPPMAEVKASLDGGGAERDHAPPPLVTPAPAGPQERPSAAREDSCAPGPHLRGDDGEAAAHPAATNLAPEQVRDEASLAPLPLAGGAGGGPVPKPTRAPRHHEWTRAKMIGFLRELAACQNVGQAARSVGMGRQSAYKLRDRMQGTPFALGWEVALESGVQQLAHALMDRALNGEEVPVYYQGECVGTHRKYDNRLATWLIENHTRLGRQPAARSTAIAAGEWEALLERIEWDSSQWYDGEELLCAPSHLQELAGWDEGGESDGDGAGK